MSIGRKPKTSNIDSDWERVFYKSVGFYLQSIIIGLKENVSFEFVESGQDLLEKIRNLNPRNFPEIKESEIPFEIPKHWAWCRLGEIIEFTTNLNIETKLKADTLIDYVDIDAIDNKTFKIREVKTKTVSELSSRARRVLKKGFIIYSLVRPYLNNLAIITEERENFIGSTGFAVFKGILVNNEYLKFLLLTDFIRNCYLDLISGFNSPSITQEQFVNTLVPLPPLVEQERIVSFLNDLEKDSLKNGESYFDLNVEQKIINLQKSQLTGLVISSEISQQLELVRQLRQAFLREAMQGKLVPQDDADEPAEILLEKIKAEKEKLIAEKKIKKDKPLPEIKPEEIPFEIPNNWTWCRLGEIITMIYGSGLTKAQTKPNADFPVFGSNGIVGFYDEFLTDKRAIIIGRKGSSGALNISEKPSWTTDVAYYTEEINNLDFSFLYYLLSNLNLDKLGKGIKPGLNRSEAYNLSVPLPPLAEQKRIVEKLEKLMKYCDELEANIRESKQRAETLLQIALKEALESKH